MNLKNTLYSFAIAGALASPVQADNFVDSNYVLNLSLVLETKDGALSSIDNFCVEDPRIPEGSAARLYVSGRARGTVEVVRAGTTLSRDGDIAFFRNMYPFQQTKVLVDDKEICSFTPQGEYKQAEE